MLGRALQYCQVVWALMEGIAESPKSRNWKCSDECWMSGDVYRLIFLAGKLSKCGLIKLAFLNLLCLTVFPSCMCAVAILHMYSAGRDKGSLYESMMLVRGLVTSSHGKHLACGHHEGLK